MSMLHIASNMARPLSRASMTRLGGMSWVQATRPKFYHSVVPRLLHAPQVAKATGGGLGIGASGLACVALRQNYKSWMVHCDNAKQPQSSDKKQDKPVKALLTRRSLLATFLKRFGFERMYGVSWLIGGGGLIGGVVYSIGGAILCLTWIGWKEGVRLFRLARLMIAPESGGIKGYTPRPYSWKTRYLIALWFPYGFLTGLFHLGALTFSATQWNLDFVVAHYALFKNSLTPFTAEVEFYNE